PEGRPRLEVLSAGEYMRVDCPYCGDQRKRLWINHRWGRYEESLDSKNLWLAYCYNEHCLAQPGRARHLYERLFNDVGDGAPPQDIVRRGRRPSPTPSEVGPPGTVVALSSLELGHHAVRYLSGRGFDAVDIYSRYGVRYCTEALPEYPLVTGRIVIPIAMRSKIVGWQARLISEPSSKHIPKWYSMPHFKKTEVLYGYDQAKQHPIVVVTEGIMDAWRYGPGAVALLGKTLSQSQALLLTQTWRDGVIACMLDGDAPEENRALCERLSISHPRVLRVDLPDGKDPADCTRDFLRKAVEEAAAARGLDLDALRKAGA
ncbi:MAG: hypothetical protein K2W96_23895, partial [Gemmataceae bacterium]|nr:hypothetical protein [Gemmataceae bacterium]